MSYGLPSMAPWLLPQSPGYFDAWTPNTSTMQDASVWIPTLNNLRGQRGYLEDLLAKTVTKLHALRDKQTRNERTLNINPEYSRSKRKKISQNKWRTKKTIEMCEKEERVILECLQVCRSNIDALESMLYQVGYPSAVPEHNPSGSYTGSESSGVQWTHGWTDENDPISPFALSRDRPIASQEISPEEEFEPRSLLIGNVTRREVQHLTAVPVLSSRLDLYKTSKPSLQPHLSPQAAVFEPDSTNNQSEDRDVSREMDKLSISGLLSSRYMRQQLSRRSLRAPTVRSEFIIDAHDVGPISSERKNTQQKGQAELPITIKRAKSV